MQLKAVSINHDNDMQDYENKYEITVKIKIFSHDKIRRTNLKRPYYKAGVSVATDRTKITPTPNPYFMEMIFTASVKKYAFTFKHFVKSLFSDTIFFIKCNILGQSRQLIDAK